MTLQRRIEFANGNFFALKNLFLEIASKVSYPDQKNDLDKVFQALKDSFCKIETKRQKEIANLLKSYKGRDNCSLLLGFEGLIKQEEIDPGVISFDTIVTKTIVEKPVNQDKLKALFAS